MTAPLLFPRQAKSVFLAVTGKGYDNMKYRLARLGVPLLFNKVEFRVAILDRHMGGEYDGVIMCRYCIRIIDITDVAFDHAVPLSRGGSWGLENIEAICQSCNAIKSDGTPEEYMSLLSWAEREVPLWRTSLFKRLKEHSKLLAGKRRAEVLARTSGMPRQPKVKPPLVAATDQSF